MLLAFDMSCPYHSELRIIELLFHIIHGHISFNFLSIAVHKLYTAMGKERQPSPGILDKH